ncbi:MAG TPA: hypothetical protein VHV26_04850 [Rhizomicrobium sp.]|nr:hypothetical protein [Rhizomicrobium sp.]
MIDEPNGAMSQPDYASYKSCMEEIKRRQHAIDDILSGNRSTTFKYTNVEFVALQFRKVFELIILSTLASNRHLFENLTRKLSKEWQISKVTELVEKKNADFYPRPIDRAPTTQGALKDEWKDVQIGYLTLFELTAAHGKIGNLMHAHNPYKAEIESDAIENDFPSWRTKTIRLLNNHIVKFPDETVLYVGMQSVETGDVHMSLFGKVSSIDELEEFQSRLVKAK